MDEAFPFLVLACGLILRAALAVPGAREKIERMHPLPDSHARMDKASWVFLSVGCLWGLQHLLF